MDLIEMQHQQYQRLAMPDLVMPEPAQTIVLALFIGIAVLLAIVAIRMSLRREDFTPLVFLIVGTITSFTTEALPDLLVHMSHATIGIIPAYVAFTKVIPLHIFFVYSMYFGAFYMYAYPRMLDHKLEGAFLWKIFYGSALMAYFFEAGPVMLGMWSYAAPQPLWIWKGTMPVNIAFMNAFCIVFGLVLMDKLLELPLSRGRKWFVMLVAGPIGPVMAHIGAGMPYYWTVNASVPQWALELGGLASIGTSWLGTWLLIQFAYLRRDG